MWCDAMWCFDSRAFIVIKCNIIIIVVWLGSLIFVCHIDDNHAIAHTQIVLRSAELPQFAQPKYIFISIYSEMNQVQTSGFIAKCHALLQLLLIFFKFSSATQIVVGGLMHCCILVKSHWNVIEPHGSLTKRKGSKIFHIFSPFHMSLASMWFYPECEQITWDMRTIRIKL